MSRVRKVVAAIKEIDTEGKIKMDFSDIVARDDINKEEDIVSTNNRLEKHCEGNEFFFIDNGNIDASRLNKSKLHRKIGKVHTTYNQFHNILRFNILFYQIFLSPKVKQCAIITYKHGMYELSHELPNDFRLRILGY